MGKKYLEIRLKPDGSIQVETHGVKGKACLQYIGMMENMIGGRVVDSDYTGEYYESDNAEAVIIKTEEKEMV